MPASVVRAARERFSSVLLLPIPSALDTALLDRGVRAAGEPLATPPPGSGLLAVHGDQGLPGVGHALRYVRYGTDFLRRRTERFGPVSWMGMPNGRAVVVAGPAASREVLAGGGRDFSQEGWRIMVERFFHRGLMLLDFDEHKMHRRIMQAAFTADRVAGYVGQTVPVVREIVPTWGALPGPVRLYPALKRLTLDIATRVFMDGRSGPDADRINTAFVDCVRAANAFVRAPIPGTRWYKGLRGRRVLEDWFYSELPAKRAGDGDDLFSALCHAETPDGQRFSDADVVNHMIFLMMAAHDTSTITVAAAAYHLARNPEWQERARAESLALGETPPDVAALRGLETLDLVIREALRLNAPVPVVMRTAVRDTAIAGHHVPAGTRVVVAQGVNHFDPGCWTDPDRFDPERFAEPRREDRSDRDAWIPFGGGAHKCIGLHFGTLEVTAILHEMLRTYRWHLEPGYRARWDNTSLPVPVGGIPVRFTPARASGSR